MENSEEKNLFSIITLNYNRLKDLCQLLNSLTQQTMPEFETIVVDNGSTEDSLDVVERDYPEVKVIKLKENQGISGFNIGVSSVQSKYSILLDNDVIVFPDFIEKLHEKVIAYPDISVFALDIITENGFRQKDYLPQNASMPMLWHNFIGGGAVFSTADYKELGGYDARYFVYVNETEFSARILLAGKKILFCPEIKVIHKTSPIARDTELSYFYFLRNSILFMKTYFKFLKKIDLIAGFLTINLKKAVRLGKIRTYVKAIIEAYKVVPSCRPHKKLKGDLASKLAGSWQGDPSLSRTLRRILCVRFR